MDYLQTDKDPPPGNATLLVFLPDAIKSQLVGSIEQWVRDRTACAPVARQWISFTNEALSRFYPRLEEELPSESWHLVCSYFSARPCLATLWIGENASQVIPKVKGETHPAQCSGLTIRGRFWCDNALANLVHVSDDCREAARELDVLRSIVPNLFGGRLSPQGLAPFRDWGPPTPRHSGILTLCSVITTMLSTQGSSFPWLELPDGEDAKETMARAEAWLEQVRASTSVAVAEAVESYVDGTADPALFIGALKDKAPVGAWEELILRVGILSRPQWLRARQT